MLLVRLSLAASVMLPEGGVLGVLCRSGAIANTFSFGYSRGFLIDLDMCFFLICICDDAEKSEY